MWFSIVGKQWRIYGSLFLQKINIQKIYISYDSVDNFVNDLQKYEILKLENEKLGILKYLNLF